MVGLAFDFFLLVFARAGTSGRPFVKYFSMGGLVCGVTVCSVPEADCTRESTEGASAEAEDTSCAF